MFGFWCFMLVCVMLIPLCMVLLGTRFLKKPPANINKSYGYRTTRSMKSQEAWAFAHQYCGKLWRTLGWLMLPLSVLAMLPAMGRETNFVGILGGSVTLVQCAVMFVATLFLTERALKKKFGPKGS